MCVITSRSRAALARARALWNFWHTKLFEVKRGRTSGAACEGYFILKPLGATKVKGVSEPVNVYEVNGLGPLRTRLQRSAGRGLTKFIGRAREMEALEHAAELAKSGRGQIAAAMAEPGVGKSRLFFEFKAKNQSGWMVLETFSISHGKASAYLPVIDLLRNYFRVANEDDERTRREKVAMRDSVESETPGHASAIPVGVTSQQLRFIRLLIVERRDLQHAVCYGGFRQRVGLGEAVHAQELGMKQRAALREIFFGIELNRERQSRRSYGAVRLGG